MKSIVSTLEKINDSLNPIVVKELRQVVQGKFLVVVLMLFLVVQLFAMGIFMAYMRAFSASGIAFSSFSAGRTIFTILLGILSTTCLLFVPAYTGIRLATERSDANVDLLFITTLRPRSIIWGKFLAALILTVLFYSACMPFMTFTYLLRGIDLPSIFILLVFNFIIIAASIQCAILISCFPTGRGFKVILGVIWLNIVGTIFSSTIVLSVLLLNIGIGSQINSWEFWRVALSVLVGGAALIGLLALLSTALISPLSTNRALPVRIFFTVIWLLIGIGMAIWSLAIGEVDPIAAWASVYTLLYCIALFIAVSERERLGQRVRQSIPRQRLQQLLIFPFYSGAANGVVWSSLMIFLTLLALSVCLIVFPYIRTSMDVEAIGSLAGLGIYAFSYALGASLIRRSFLSNRVSGGYTWAVALALLVIATTLIPLILFFSSGDWQDEWFIGSPIFLFLSILNGTHDYLWLSILIAAIGALIVGILSIPWLIRQITDFSPPYREATIESQRGDPEKS